MMRSAAALERSDRSATSHQMIYRGVKQADQISLLVVLCVRCRCHVSHQVLREMLFAGRAKLALAAVVDA